MATVIKISGHSETSEEVVMPENPKLEWFQKLVGGYIEFVTFRDGSALMVHEEGRLIGLLPNVAATALCAIKGSPQPLPIVGDAVFFSRTEMKAMDSEEDEEADDPLDTFTHDRVGDSTGDDDGC